MATALAPAASNGHEVVGFSGKDAPESALINTCVHCGLCLSSCPTYRETGLEMSSPRGRIYLMRAVNEGRMSLASGIFQGQMSQCLNCRACEAVCPSGVQYGAIVEASRAQIQTAREHASGAGPVRPQGAMTRLVRALVFDRLFKSMSLFRKFSWLMKLYQVTGLQWIARNLGVLKLLGTAEMEAMLP